MRYHTRSGRLRALRAFGLFMAGYTGQEIAKKLGRAGDRRMACSRARAYVLVHHGFELVAERCPARYPEELKLEAWANGLDRLRRPRHSD